MIQYWIAHVLLAQDNIWGLSIYTVIDAVSAIVKAVLSQD